MPGYRRIFQGTEGLYVLPPAVPPLAITPESL